MPIVKLDQMCRENISWSFLLMLVSGPPFEKFITLLLWICVVMSLYALQCAATPANGASWVAWLVIYEQILQRHLSALLDELKHGKGKLQKCIAFDAKFHFPH